MRKFILGTISTIGLLSLGYVSGVTSCVLHSTADTLEGEEFRESLKEITKARAKATTEKIRSTYQKGKKEGEKAVNKTMDDFKKLWDKLIEQYNNDELQQKLRELSELAKNNNLFTETVDKRNTEEVSHSISSDEEDCNGQLNN